MAKLPRKRFNAFEDFPAGEEAAQPAVEAARPITARVETIPAEQVERIERLKPSQMLPDRFQPRRLLPTALRDAFFSGQIDCYQAAAEWIALSRSDPSYRAEIERLLSMGGSFEEHGQIKPITGSWVPASDGRYIFLIETGERRFWAACLQAATRNLREEPLLRVEVVAHPTRQRQVLENRHAETPSAVGQACEIASLILAEMGITPEANTSDEFEFFRKYHDQRMPPGMWDKVMPIMQLTRPRMVQLLGILRLPTPLLELADRHRVPERVLREVLGLPQNQWEPVIRASIQNSLTSDEVEEAAAQVARGEKVRKPAALRLDPDKIAGSALRRFAKILGEMDEFGQAQALDSIADTLVVTGEAEGVLNLLSELSRMVDARIMRKAGRE